MTNQDKAIHVQNLSKEFKLPHEKRSSIKSAFVNIFRKQTFERQQVLKDVSFEIKKGEFFGIVGRNGSGKSTLLKLLAGIYNPAKGSITVSGKLVPFIELGVGFNPELTGRENVFLNGALLGFNRKEMLQMYKEIVAFAELERFMDQKLKNYSSGMQVRLAFSIAIRVKTDILVLDEVLAVGDSSFQDKCQEYFRSIKNTDQTVILVTHDMRAVTDYCDRALLLDNGEVRLIGDPIKVAEAYAEINRAGIDEENEVLVASQDHIKREAEVLRAYTRDPLTKKKKSYFANGEEIEVVVDYKIHKAINDAVIDIGLRAGIDGPYIFYTDTHHKKIKLSLSKGDKKRISFTIPNVFNAQNFYIATSMYDMKTSYVYARNRQAAKFRTQELENSSMISLEHNLQTGDAR